MENFSKELRERAQQLYLEGNVLGLLKKGNLLIGLVKDLEIYRVEFNLSDKSGKCECKLGNKCEHIFAVQIAYEKGEYVDFDNVEKNLMELNKRELLGILLNIMEKYPIVANYVEPIENIIEALERYLNIIKQNPGENVVNNFTDFLVNNKNKINKNDLIHVLETIASCNNKCFYNFIAEREYDKVLMKTIAELLVEKGLNDDDIKKVEEILEKDRYGNLDNLILSLFSYESVKNKLNSKLIVKILLRRKEKQKVLQLLDNGIFSDDEKFEILKQIDENEAVEFAKVNMLYSKLFNYYYNIGELSQAIFYLNKMIELKNLKDIAQNVDVIIELIKGKDDIIEKLFNLANESVILYPLLPKLYNISSGSLKYDIGIASLNKINYLKDEYADLIKIAGEQRKDKLQSILEYLIDYLVEEKRYEDITKALEIAKKYMKTDNFNDFISHLKQKYKRRKQAFEFINKNLS